MERAVGDGLRRAQQIRRAASRFSIGLVIAAGMTIGTLFTLFVTPVVYTYVARDHTAHRARAAAPAAAPHGQPAE